MPRVFAAAVLVLAVMTACSSSSATSVRLPPVAGRFDYQIGGAYPPGAGAEIVDRDRTDPPVDGLYNICYVNAFQTQPGDESAWWRRRHDDLLLHSAEGRPVIDPAWPGETVLDTSTSGRRNRLAAIIGNWVDGCAKAGFDAVELDNLDSWTRKGTDGRLTAAGNLDLARRLVVRAHEVGLAVGQKNAVEVAVAGRHEVGFDFAIAEECQVFDECDRYRAAYGDDVIEIEYTDTGPAPFDEACARRGGEVSVILRDRDVSPLNDPDHRYRTCPGA